MEDDFDDIVGSENYENSREEFIAGLSKCKENIFTVDPTNQTIVFEKSCPKLVLHYPELYTEIYCSQCQICVEINFDNTETASVVSEDADDMDEFMAIAGTQYQDNAAYYGGTIDSDSNEDYETLDTVESDDYPDEY